MEIKNDRLADKEIYGWKTVQDSEEFKKLRELMPELHPAYIGFCLSYPNLDVAVPGPDDMDGWKRHYENMKAKGPDGTSEADRLKATLSEAFAGCDFEGTEIDGYDFSQENMDAAMDGVEYLLTEAEKTADPEKAKQMEAMADKCRRIVDAQNFALNFLPVAMRQG